MPYFLAGHVMKNHAMLDQTPNNKSLARFMRSSGIDKGTIAALMPCEALINYSTAVKMHTRTPSA
jgi:hypothetical protein